MNSEVYVYALSAILILLGFVALIKQKTYIDSSGSPTDVEVPFLGKLKTNYPALVFIFLACGLVYVAFTKEKGNQQWKLKGHFRNGEPTVTHQGTLEIHPGYVDIVLEKDGAFDVEITVPKGVQLEDWIELIEFKPVDAPARVINLREEFKKYEKGDSSLIETLSATSRIYKPVLLQ